MKKESHKEGELGETGRTIDEDGGGFTQTKMANSTGAVMEAIEKDMDYWLGKLEEIMDDIERKQQDYSTGRSLPSEIQEIIDNPFGDGEIPEWFRKDKRMQGEEWKIYGNMIRIKNLFKRLDSVYFFITQARYKEGRKKNEKGHAYFFGRVGLWKRKWSFGKDIYKQVKEYTWLGWEKNNKVIQ